MTIAAAYLTSEGVVLGADSSTTIQVSVPEQQLRGVVQVLNHAQKVFEVGHNSRFGVCAWGVGMAPTASHRTVVARLADQIEHGRATVRDVGTLLASVVRDAYKAKPEARPAADQMGYFVGGWDPHTHDPACYYLRFDGSGELKDFAPLEKGEARFAGAHEYYSRAFYGFDPALPDALYRELCARLKNLPPGFQEAFQGAFSAAASRLPSSGFRDLPIREAIDYVHTFLHVTIKASKFRFGLPPAGGPIEIAFITTDRPFRWVSRKSYASAISEHEAEQHG